MLMKIGIVFLILGLSILVVTGKPRMRSSGEEEEESEQDLVVDEVIPAHRVRHSGSRNRALSRTFGFGETHDASRRSYSGKSGKGRRALNSANDGPAAPMDGSAIPPGSKPASNETVQGYVRTNCISCLLREEAKLARIEQVQRDLLQKLGLAHKPNASSLRDFPPVRNTPIQTVLEKLGYQSDGVAADEPYELNMKDDDLTAKTEGIYSFARAGKPKSIL